MLALERHRRLLDFLNEKGSGRTTVLARMLNVTEETVRRDFEKLEKDGVLIRSHGGAMRLETQRREFPVGERASQNAPEKRKIARRALRLIEQGQTIFLDPSTTIHQLARLIPDHPLTILTNSLQIPPLFVDKPEVHVVLLGGNFRSSSLSCVGYAAVQMLDLFRIDMAFMSCRGIDVERGLSEATEEQATLKRHVIGQVPALYLLADATKLGLASSHFFARNSDVDLWITDRLPDAPLRRQLKAQGLQIEVA